MPKTTLKFKIAGFFIVLRKTHKIGLLTIAIIILSSTILSDSLQAAQNKPIKQFSDIEGH